MKKLLFIFTLFFSVIFAVCCSKPEIKLVGEDSVELGCSIVLTTNYEGDEEIVWESSHPNTASVVDGVVTGNEIGDAIITVKIGGVSKSKVITVTSPVIQITIEGETSIIIGKSSKFNATLSKETNEPVEWKSSDTSIATVDSDGKVTGISEGQVIISASVYENKSEFTVFITKKNPYAISLRGKNVLARGKEMQLEYTVYPSDASNELIFVSENEDILTVNASGVVKAVSEGKGVIKAYSKFNESIASTIEIEVKKPAPDEIRISGETEIMQGGFSTLNIDVIGNDVTKEVVWESENPKVAVCYNGIVLGVNKGKTNIRAKSVIDNSVFGSIEISVKAYENKGHTQAEIDKVNEIISKMTLSQKVGQMFVIGFNGTEMNKTLEDVIEEYNFGNVIYMGYNVSRPQTLSKLSNDIQEKMIKENGVPAFITIDQEGGRVARLIDGGTHFISEMAMGATGDYNNTYLEGVAMGKELRNYGINVDFAPVLDVNNNPNNPVIGIRSYSDNPILVSLYGNNMIAGLMESDVMACSKHFPGHGNTSVDSHYGLPTITTPIEELYQTELAPFIRSICNGIDSIMTTHIIFKAIDSE